MKGIVLVFSLAVLVAAMPAIAAADEPYIDCSNAGGPMETHLHAAHAAGRTGIEFDAVYPHAQRSRIASRGQYGNETHALNSDGPHAIQRSATTWPNTAAPVSGNSGRAFFSDPPASPADFFR